MRSTPATTLPTSNGNGEREYAGSALTSGFHHLCLALACLGTIEVRVRVGQLPSFAVAELLAYPIAACLALELALRPRLSGELRAVYRRNRPVFWYAGYAGVASVLGLVRSADSLQVFKDLVPAVVLYVLAVMTVDSHRRAVDLLAASLAGAMVTVGLGALQAATGGYYIVPLSENIEDKLDLAGDQVQQLPTGLFGHPNSVAVLLLPVALFLMVAIWPGLTRDRRVRLGMLGLLAATLIVLAETYAKGVYVWLGVGVLFIILPRSFDRWRFGLAVVTVILGITALIVVSILLLQDGDLRFGTIVSRIELWLGAITIIGSDRFVAVFGAGGPLMHDVISVEYPNAHNAWLNQALNYGVPALAFYLASFLVAMRWLGRVVLTAQHPTRPLALAAMASLMALWGEYFFEPSNRGVAFQVQLFTLFALAAIVRPRRSPSTRAYEGTTNDRDRQRSLRSAHDVRL